MNSFIFKASSSFIPSNSARSGGVIYPIVSNIPPMVESYPDKNPRKLGAYLYWVALAATCVTSTLFLTGLAPNLLAITTAEIIWFQRLLIELGVPQFGAIPMFCDNQSAIQIVKTRSFMSAPNILKLIVILCATII